MTFAPDEPPLLPPEDLDALVKAHGIKDVLATLADICLDHAGRALAHGNSLDADRLRHIAKKLVQLSR